MVADAKRTFKRKAVAFTGPSDSGKTTLIVKIAALIADVSGGAAKVAIVKNDPKDKGRFDQEGKDSDRFYKTGAEVAVVSPTRTTIFKRRSSDIDDLIAIFADFDYLFVEGLKHLPLPRIAVFRNAIDEDYYAYAQALAIDDSVDRAKYKIPKTLDILDLNDPRAALAWIEKRAKEV
ncbi:MAG: molybdopterin-guanine dinucleotide biosynthesis protein B [Helicobacteraceae bacterium]|nr:molybdopterin-guanine dinucleotide biosynthesis protein B [Helicobacteraceae bacterium]